MRHIPDEQRDKYFEEGLLRYCKNMQRNINNGLWLKLEGSYGRAVVAAMDAGQVMLGTRQFKDYWGNPVPSRYDVTPGSQGSRERVESVMGLEWVEQLEGVSDD